MTRELFKMSKDAKTSKITGELRLGHVIKQIPLLKMPTVSGYFMYVKLNDHPDLINEGAHLVAERIRSLNVRNPYFVTAEASTIAMAHVLRDQYQIDGIVLKKNKQIDDINAISVSYHSVTSAKKKKLFLGVNKAIDLFDKEIVIVDSICTSGQTIKAIYDILIKAGIESYNIKEAIVLFTEGDPLAYIAVDQGAFLNIHGFSHLTITRAHKNTKTT